MARFLFTFLLLGVMGTRLTASGTFIYPPDPPKKIPVVNEAQFEMGRKFFTKTFPTGQSCANCHGKKAEKKFRRRGLHRKINKLLGQFNKCATDPQRLGIEKPYQPEDSEFRSVRFFLAKEYRLLEYLK